MRAPRSILLLTSGFLVAKAQTPPPASPPDGSDLYQVGQQLFEQYAPPEIKAQYAFPTQDQWDQFATRLQGALDGNSLGNLAAYAPEARQALVALRALPGDEAYADWLALRLDEIEAADQATHLPIAIPPSARAQSSSIPYYSLWLARLQNRPLPPGAAALMPRLRAAFQAEGVPPELAWLAEAESSLNAEARSPAGATGLFQFTAVGAKSVGLRTFLPDERTEPEASARAAARMLRSLYARFGSWPVALAAYNAGESRVGRLSAARSESDFADLASGLPAETRMYVPKVLALVTLRTGVTPGKLPAPRA